MKKLFTLLLIISTLLFCTGCNKPSDSNNANADNSPQLNPNTSMEGVLQDNVYTNYYLNLKFEASESWVFFDRETLAGRTGADPQQSIKENADTDGAAYAMMAVNAPKNASVSLVYENLKITAGETLTAEEYIDSVIIPGLDLESQSFLDDITAISFGGNTYSRVSIVTENLNSTMIQTHYLRSIDDYMVHITATVPQQNESEFDFDSMFS